MIAERAEAVRPQFPSNLPEGVAVDQATDTVYVANNANGDAPASVSVINGATCNGTHHSGCGRTPTKKPAGSGAFWVAVNPRPGPPMRTGQSE